MNTTGKVLTGFLLGAATGALLGVLYAPKKGRKTREAIANKTREFSDAITHRYANLKKAIMHDEMGPEKEVVHN
ncbi:MAG: hypothetical protein KatS3mg032_0238 [Cyclobacteriaceae bacterium]|nr:MAG: hypothetical protein KatS3mg032_0238 [Cyclobacteriaceae bacterium]